MAAGVPPAGGSSRQPHTPDFNLQPGRSRPNLRGMFDTIKAELTTAADKLAHLRRFL
jgi:hypothetical protein